MRCSPRLLPQPLRLARAAPRSLQPVLPPPLAPSAVQAGDACTVLDAVPQPATLCGVAGHVHGGFLAAACNLVQPVAAALRAAAERCPGSPVLLCGHSLGGGVAAVLTMLLLDMRQRAEAAAEAGLQLAPEQAAVVEALGRLGGIRCIGIGAAAAFCRQLGMASHAHVTSVLFGCARQAACMRCVWMDACQGVLCVARALQCCKSLCSLELWPCPHHLNCCLLPLPCRADCLPMFSVLGARLLIQEVHAKSRLAGLVRGLLTRTQTGRGSSGAAGGRSTLERSTSSSSAGSSWQSGSTEPSEIEEALECSAQPPAGGSRHLRRCSSAWSSASTASIAAFAADAASEEGSEGGSPGGDRALPMFPPGEAPCVRAACWHGEGMAHCMLPVIGWCLLTAVLPLDCLGQLAASQVLSYAPSHITCSPAGRILWLLPDERDPSAKPQMVQVDQNAVRGLCVHVCVCLWKLAFCCDRRGGIAMHTRQTITDASARPHAVPQPTPTTAV